MKNYIETLKAIEILKQENKSKVRTVKLHLLKGEIENLETTLEYKKGGSTRELMWLNPTKTIT